MGDKKRKRYVLSCYMGGGGEYENIGPLTWDELRSVRSWLRKHKDYEFTFENPRDYDEFIAEVVAEGGPLTIDSDGLHRNEEYEFYLTRHCIDLVRDGKPVDPERLPQLISRMERIDRTIALVDRVSNTILGAATVPLMTSGNVTAIDSYTHALHELKLAGETLAEAREILAEVDKDKEYIPAVK